MGYSIGTICTGLEILKPFKYAIADSVEAYVRYFMSKYNQVDLFQYSRKYENTYDCMYVRTHVFMCLSVHRYTYVSMWQK